MLGLSWRGGYRWVRGWARENDIEKPDRKERRQCKTGFLRAKSHRSDVSAYSVRFYLWLTLDAVFQVGIEEPWHSDVKNEELARGVLRIVRKMLSKFWFCDICDIMVLKEARWLSWPSISSDLFTHRPVLFWMFLLSCPQVHYVWAKIEPHNKAGYCTRTRRRRIRLPMVWGTPRDTRVVSH